METQVFRTPEQLSKARLKATLDYLATNPRATTDEIEQFLRERGIVGAAIVPPVAKEIIGEESEKRILEVLARHKGSLVKSFKATKTWEDDHLGHDIVVQPKLKLGGLPEFYIDAKSSLEGIEKQRREMAEHLRRTGQMPIGNQAQVEEAVDKALCEERKILLNGRSENLDGEFVKAVGELYTYWSNK